MHDRSCYELSCTSVMCSSPKSLLRFKAFPELSFYRIMPVNRLQGTFKISCQQNTYCFFRDMRIRQICQLLNMCGISLVVLSLLIIILLILQMNSGYAYKQCGIFFQWYTFKICLIPCHIVQQYLLQRVVATPNTDFIHLILFFFALKIESFACTNTNHLRIKFH